jgi:hypothetical protein
MPDSFSIEAFYDSALQFARTALEAHHNEDYRRVALDAGTALEHLAKAALASRSLALLADLRHESSVASLAWLLKVKDAKPPARIRSISLWEALLRVRPFVSSAATQDDLRTLVDMRDGVVHAAQDAEMEARVLTAFVQQADALLADLGRARSDFWAGQQMVVDALLADATDKVAHRVAIKLAAAEASFAHEYGSMDPQVARMVRIAREVSMTAPLAPDESVMRCPVCESNGVALGSYDVEYGDPDWDHGVLVNVDAFVVFTAVRFFCRICRLRLDNPAELAAAKVNPSWQIEDADPREYEPAYEIDEDAAYDAWRDERAEREGWR